MKEVFIDDLRKKYYSDLTTLLDENNYVGLQAFNDRRYLIITKGQYKGLAFSLSAAFMINHINPCDKFFTFETSRELLLWVFTNDY